MDDDKILTLLERINHNFRRLQTVLDTDKSPHDAQLHALLESTVDVGERLSEMVKSSREDDDAV